VITIKKRLTVEQNDLDEGIYPRAFVIFMWINQTFVSDRKLVTLDVTMYLEDHRNAVLSRLYLFYCQVTLHVSGVSRTHHQEHTSCSYKHWYKSKVWRV